MSRLDRAAAAFVKSRPDCVRLLVRLARAEKAAGAKRLSAKRLFENARPLVKKSGKGKRVRGQWALNNSLTSRVARILERNFQDLRGCFELRRLAGDRE